MAESQRGKLTGRKIVRKIKDSVSVSEGRRGSSSGGGSSSSRTSSSGGSDKSIQLNETLRVQSSVQTQGRHRAPRPQISSRPTVRGVPKEAGAFLLGARATAKLRSQTEEERKKEPLPVQISQGVAEGIGQTAFVLGSAPLVVAEDVKNFIQGKPFRPPGNFFEQVLKETRPSTLSQSISQVAPGAKRESISFDPTSLSRAGGEVAGLIAGAKVLNIGSPRIPISSGTKATRPSFGFTKTNVNLGQGRVGPFTGPDVPFTPSQLQPTGPLIKLGSGVGKTILRDTPPRSPFLQDVLGRTKSEIPFKIPKQGAFKGSDFGLGRGASKIIEGTAKQTQQTGLRTLVKTKQVKSPKVKSELDILRQGPRFKGTRIAAGESKLETLRFPKQSTTFKPFIGAASLGAGAVALGQATKTQPSFKLDAIPASTFKFTDAIKTKKGTRLTTPSRSAFRFSDDTSFKLTTTPKLGTPTRQRTTTILRPPQRPPKVPVRPVFAGFPLGRPAAFTSFGDDTKGSTKSIFGAFAISENINIGRLPGPLSEFSTSSKVFGKLDKRDKAFQDAIFGKPRRKSKSKKASRKKRKR